MLSIPAGVDVPCTDGTLSVPCRMDLTAAGPFVVCEEGKCSIPLNGKFTLAVEIVSRPEVGYILAQSWIDFGSDLTYHPTVMAIEEIVWPDCEAAVAFRIPPEQLTTFVGHACLTALVEQPPSFDVGINFAEMSLTCSDVETSTLVRLLPSGEPPAGTAGALFTSFNSIQIVPEVGDLTIHCGAPPTPTPGGPDTPTPSDTPTGTLTPATATPTPSETPTGTLTPATATPTPSDTPTGTLTPGLSTPAGTVTATVSGTPATPTDTPTPTPIPSSTPTRRRSPLGDVNCDGIVDPVDAVFLLQLEAALIDALPCPDAGDVDEDGETTLIDAALILQFSAGLISSLPP